MAQFSAVASRLTSLQISQERALMQDLQKPFGFSSFVALQNKQLLLPNSRFFCFFAYSFGNSFLKHALQ